MKHSSLKRNRGIFNQNLMLSAKKYLKISIKNRDISAFSTPQYDKENSVIADNDSVSVIASN
ncbi:hypothetical protein [Helicobacter sp. T3_23-1056]